MLFDKIEKWDKFEKFFISKLKMDKNEKLFWKLKKKDKIEKWDKLKKGKKGQK